VILGSDLGRRSWVATERSWAAILGGDGAILGGDGEILDGDGAIFAEDGTRRGGDARRGGGARRRAGGGARGGAGARSLTRETRVRASVSNPLQPDVARRVSGGSNGPKPSETCLPNSPDGVSSGLKLGRVRHPKTQKNSPTEQGLMWIIFLFMTY
jgi:hypothetical protein